MIKTAGANVSPAEVEAAILEVSGLVAHVVGIDDPERGQVVAALIRAPEGSVDLDDLRARLRRVGSPPTRCRSGCSSFPDEAVPMMSSGKLDLRALGRCSVQPEPETIPALLARRRTTTGARCRGHARRSGDLRRSSMQRAQPLAASFVADGVVKGDRLGLLAPNGTEWAVVAFAAMRIGAVLVPLSTLLRPPELLAQLTTASCRTS